MKKLVVVLGDLATGKSTFAKIIAEKYDLELISKDDIKEILGDQIGFKDREENIKLSKTSYSLLYFVLEKACSKNIDVILEANFHEEQLKSIEGVARKYEYEILKIVINGDPSVLYKRYMNRLINEHRNPVHASIPFSSCEDFKEYTLSNREKNLLGTKIEIDATSFDYQSDSKILKQIESFLR
ncbi:MAG: AAA family ATPase [Erysipelotrichaceae bacterium]|nr:AAA family ATPase [Erysipelotrichaceae bacterium]